MRLVKILVLVIFIAFVAIQFVPTSRNESNVVSNMDLMNIYNVPENIGTILRTSCYDCHSNNTNYPWYNWVQPMSWFLEDHIKRGKEELNLSEFSLYSKRRQKSKLKAIASQIKENEMPLSSYTLIHRDAKISESDKKMIVEWASNMIDSL